MKKILALLLFINFTILSAKTLVTVNGHKITDSLLSEGYNQLDETQKSNLIEQLIKEEVLYAELLKTSVVNSPQFQQAFDQQKGLVEQQYGKQLNTEQLRSIKGSIAVSLYQQDAFQKVILQANESKSFYDNNPEKFTFPNSIEIANIIVQDEAEAKKILKSLQSSQNLDEDFVKTANAHQQHGYMGWFGRDNMPENLFDKAYKYKVKRLLNAPVKTKHGYNVVYLLNKKAAGKLSFQEAQPKIEQMLKQQRVMQQLIDKVNKLYANAEIVY
jgi:parvulin-like peptidyl-prolyl isomerase